MIWDLGFLIWDFGENVFVIPHVSFRAIVCFPKKFDDHNSKYKKLFIQTFLVTNNKARDLNRTGFINKLNKKDFLPPGQSRVLSESADGNFVDEPCRTQEIQPGEKDSDLRFPDPRSRLLF